MNGAVNGTLLGGATMALQNSNDFDPLRVGLGAGILYGLSVGIYDLAQTTTGQRYYVSGTFNDGDNSSIIVLLDTFYGVAAGALVATSFNLIANESIQEGLQYGAGFGAWAGFGFGLIDAFMISERASDFQSASNRSGASGGLFTISDQKAGYKVNFVNPTFYQQPTISGSTISVETTAAIDLINVNIEF
ncbi:MAG: hypothetical protein U5K69_15665 [Balneolaceae bacterium]|nr:hypothetical protein [Balneolaceae bacterium]